MDSSLSRQHWVVHVGTTGAERKGLSELELRPLRRDSCVAAAGTPKGNILVFSSVVTDYHKLCDLKQTPFLYHSSVSQKSGQAQLHFLLGLP